MRKLLIISAIALCLPLIANGQDYPKAEVFTGYSYLRGQFNANFHGWNLSAAGNPTRWFGVAGDFSGHYLSDVGNLQLFLFGPRFTYRGNGRVNPYIHTLVGGARAKADADILDDLDETALAWTVGGGVDVKVHKNVAIRAFQLDYVQTRFLDSRQHNGRFSIGVVWRFGGN